jgi:hypothetical protein
VDSAAADNDIVKGFMGDVDRTLLRENLRLNFEQRATICACCKWVEELRRAAKKLRQNLWPLISRRSFRR